ncbi:MAG: DUF2158 domain-containing protein [Pseudolabrys sp.]|jgi:uncharacterized protein YodC (DUF2158 family)
MSYSAGSIVVLKSGGPAMTVVSAAEDDIECIWMGDAGELFRQSIPAIALEAVEVEDDDDDEEDDDEEDEEDGDED